VTWSHPVSSSTVVVQELDITPDTSTCGEGKMHIPFLYLQGDFKSPCK
jgi:hypothetical protein